MILKKPKFWDYGKGNLLAYVLLPLTLPIMLNNFFLNLKKSKKNKKIKLICIGNIYIGGTGKTPAVINLFKILKKLNLNVSIGKKFYKSHIDEIDLLKKESNVIVDKSRKKIIQKAEKDKIDCLIFDDGLQDKTVSYDIQFVCFDSKSWIGNGLLIPSGPLREKLNSLKKYDAVFLKNLNDNIDEKINLIRSYNSNIKIFSTNYEIRNLNKFDTSKNYLIFSGIGNPKSFRGLLEKNKFRIIEEIIFPDHFTYSKKNIDFIKKRSKEINAKIITTEKDYIKISKIDHEDIEFLKVETKIDDEINFLNFIKSKIYD
ncbi:tetraacyldisaccharide 4'-kinase [Candidatus Pelagibacter sp.]|nr:tetraacyldisaccharide 4'-kinase [Candidatus Pelagibacter sp.]|tara:strand:+ start:378 stop:1322 length:945 start_codon:yes stop_codon:yes gene_type:complete